MWLSKQPSNALSFQHYARLPFTSAALTYAVGFRKRKKDKYSVTSPFINFEILFQNNIIKTPSRQGIRAGGSQQNRIFNNLA